MRRTAIALLLALAPAYLSAQSQPESTTPTAPSNGLSVEGRARLEAMLHVARERYLPTEPMANRVAEGQAKGASEAQIIASVGRIEAQLRASQEALIRAGRSQPSEAEVARGAEVMASGATSAELEAFVRRAPSERRLVVAFDVLTRLTERGVPVDRALAVVGGQLSAGAADGQLISLTASANGQANGLASASGGSTAASSTIGGSLTGAVGVGLIRKP